MSDNINQLPPEAAAFVAKMDREKAALAEVARATLQKVYDSPASPMEAAMRRSFLGHHSAPRFWSDGTATSMRYVAEMFRAGYQAGAQEGK